ncbi:MAG TPA: metalloregulator ArsR/SmtB family transcription factor [Sphingomicrobium sp.]|nr:metalloregulator ArsR/SmtB family transcription factor [Sphingomicrobium sp.]
MLNDSLRLDRTFAALSDPLRRGMLARLAQGPASVSELAMPLAISLPAVMQHVKALEAGGLVATEKKGRVRTVRLEPGTLSAAEGWIHDRRTEWEARLDRFEAHLATFKNDGATQ